MKRFEIKTGAVELKRKSQEQVKSEDIKSIC
jgi:hypothetical protein